MWMAAALVIACGLGRAAAGDVEAVAPGTSRGADQVPRLAGRHIVQGLSAYQLAAPDRGRRNDHPSFWQQSQHYAFPVARIDLKGQHCAIFSEAEGNRHRIDKINVARCYRAHTER